MPAFAGMTAQKKTCQVSAACFNSHTPRAFPTPVGVTPAKAGVPFRPVITGRQSGMPAFAGMTAQRKACQVSAACFNSHTPCAFPTPVGVTPAKAGVPLRRFTTVSQSGMPAFAGMTAQKKTCQVSAACFNSHTPRAFPTPVGVTPAKAGVPFRPVITGRQSGMPAFAGMTAQRKACQVSAACFNSHTPCAFPTPVGVTPAKAGVPLRRFTTVSQSGMPAFAGMTAQKKTCQVSAACFSSHTRRAFPTTVGVTPAKAGVPLRRVITGR